MTDDKLWRVSDLLNLAGADRAATATITYSQMIEQGTVKPHIEEDVLQLPSSAKIGKNTYRKHWLSTSHALAVMATVYPNAELAALALGGIIATQVVESKNIKLI